MKFPPPVCHLNGHNISGIEWDVIMTTDDADAAAIDYGNVINLSTVSQSDRDNLIPHACLRLGL